MDKERYESYEETHKKLVEAMQEACTSDEFDDYDPAYIDLSFLENEPEEEKPVRRFKPMSRFYKVATILIILLLGGNMLMMAGESGESYGDRSIVGKIVGIFDDRESTEGVELVEEYTVSEEEGISKIIADFPELYLLGYIPEGFSFEELRVEIFTTGDSRAKYEYVSEDEFLSIGLTYNLESREKIYSGDAEDIIEYNDRVIYIYKDVNDLHYVADVYFDNCTIDINGMSDKLETIKVARNIYR